MGVPLNCTRQTCLPTALPVMHRCWKWPTVLRLVSSVPRTPLTESRVVVMTPPPTLSMLTLLQPTVLFIPLITSCFIHVYWTITWAVRVLYHRSVELFLNELLHVEITYEEQITDEEQD